MYYIDEVIYGIIPSYKIAILPTAPPANILNIPIIPDWFCSKICLKVSILMPGKGKYVPKR